MLGAQHKNKAQEVVRVVHVFEFYREDRALLGPYSPGYVSGGGSFSAFVV